MIGYGGADRWTVSYVYVRTVGTGETFVSDNRHWPASAHVREAEEPPRKPTGVMAGKLSEEAWAARAPRPPEELVGALQDRIHPTSGRLLDAKPIRTTRIQQCAEAKR